MERLDGDRVFLETAARITCGDIEISNNTVTVSPSWSPFTEMRRRTTVVVAIEGDGISAYAHVLRADWNALLLETAAEMYEGRGRLQNLK